MRNIPIPRDIEEPQTQPGVIRSLWPYVNPLSIKNQARNTFANYLYNSSIYENALQHGIKWQGLTGFRWLGGISGHGEGLIGVSGSRLMSYPGAKLGSMVVKPFYGARGAEAFYTRGVRGLLEHLESTGRWKGATKGIVHRVTGFFTGGEKTTLIGLRGADVTTKGVFKVAPGTMKGIMGIHKFANWAMWISAGIAAFGWLGKKTGAFVERKLATVANKLHNLSNTEAFIAPQLVNKYSISLREAALNEIHRSSFSPKNMLLGREAMYRHQ